MRSAWNARFPEPLLCTKLIDPDSELYKALDGNEYSRSCFRSYLTSFYPDVP
jgi:hypothetical protein